MKAGYILACLVAVTGRIFSEENEGDCCKGKEMQKLVPLNFIDQIFFKVPGCIIISQGQKNEYRIQADKEALQEIKITSTSGDLTFEPKGMQIGPKKIKPIKVYVTVKNLEEVNLFGESSCSLKGINVQKLMINLQGNSQVRGDLTAEDLAVNAKGKAVMALKGTVARQSLSFEGDSKVDFSGLLSNSIDLVAKGRGDFTLKASKNLSVVIEGDANVLYYGNPKKVEQNISGKGSLRKG